MVVVGTRDALRLAVESERSDQRMSTLQHRITNLAVAAGADPNQKMHSFGEMPAPLQQQARGPPVNPPGPQPKQQTPWPMQPSTPRRRQERVASYANASYASQMQQQRSEHYDVASSAPGRPTEAW